MPSSPSTRSRAKREEGRGRRSRATRGSSKPLLLAWVVAGLVASATAAAYAAAPATDAMMPTSTYRNLVLGAGFSSDKCRAAPDPDGGNFLSFACRTDNAGMTYYMDSNGKYELESPDRTVVRNFMNYVENVSDMNVTYDSSPTFSGAGETDVIFQEGSDGMASNVIGVTWCNDPENGTDHKCDQFYIRIRGNGQIDPVTAGHEIGHAIGLTHPTWANPPSGSCATNFQIMRESYDCIGSAVFSTMLINNINWTF